MTNNKPLKCWYCAKLGKCTVLKPCKDFERYDYSKKHTIKKVASLCGWGERKLYRRLKKDVNKALRDIYELTGLRLDYVNISDENSKHQFVEMEDEE